jgi:hypothetical protein
MRTFFFLLLSAIAGHAADARVITEGATNILAIGIDSRDYSVVRFYMKGTNVLELRATDMLLNDSPIKTEVDKRYVAERTALLDALRASTNINAGNITSTVSNLVRLRLLDDVDVEAKKPK